jgi:hypothetical protein
MGADGSNRMKPFSTNRRLEGPVTPRCAGGQSQRPSTPVTVKKENYADHRLSHVPTGGVTMGTGAGGGAAAGAATGCGRDVPGGEFDGAEEDVVEGTRQRREYCTESAIEQSKPRFP